MSTGAGSSARTQVVFDTADFPGWGRFPGLIGSYIRPRPDFSVLDVGGGANPMLSAETAAGLRYTLLDIDEAELAKASPVYDKLVCADAGMPTPAFTECVGAAEYDLVYSHMFLEHVTDPDQVHRNIFAALKPGGFCIHAYPINNNIPLAVNYILPDGLSRWILRIVQPSRDLDGKVGKFPAYYRRCHSPSTSARRYYEQFGYEVVRHDGFAGHEYYARIPVLRLLAEKHQRFVVAAQIPWICFSLLVLRRPATPSH
jgi:SAM-dependent methyltransferase